MLKASIREASPIARSLAASATGEAQGPLNTYSGCKHDSGESSPSQNKYAAGTYRLRTTGITRGIRRASERSILRSRPSRAAGPGLLEDKINNSYVTPLATTPTPEPNTNEGEVNRRIAAMKRSIYSIYSHARVCHAIHPLDCYHLSLTYRQRGDYRKTHLSALMALYRTRLERLRATNPFLTFYFAWVMETQRRGCPHLHVLIWVSRGTAIPNPSRKSYRGRRKPWPHGFSAMRRLPPQVIPIAVAYLAKAKTKLNLPRGARICGYGSSDPAAKRVAAWQARPRWLREETEPGERLHEAKGGGYVSRETGELHPSPYAFSRVPNERGGWRNVFTRVDGREEPPMVCEVLLAVKPALGEAVRGGTLPAPHLANRATPHPRIALDVARSTGEDGS